eukprot:SAG31_NODE_1164_length_9581_cov_16.106623_4_plen_322_part_00
MRLFLCIVAISNVAAREFSSSDPEELNTLSPLEYAAVIDAGSSGSRMHMFAWPRAHSCLQKMASREILEIGPGRKLHISLDSLRPSEVGAYLTPLLDYADSIIPSALQAHTKLYLHATAGMRLLPAAARAQVMEAAAARLHQSHFIVARVEVVDGDEEGANEWLAANYLLGNLRDEVSGHRGLSTTVAVLGMGGASTQFVFKPKEGVSVSTCLPNTRWVSDLLCMVWTTDVEILQDSFSLSLQGLPTFSIYSHSYLGLGAWNAQQTYMTWLAKEYSVGTADSQYAQRVASSENTARYERQGHGGQFGLWGVAITPPAFQMS